AHAHPHAHGYDPDGPSASPAAGGPSHAVATATPIPAGDHAAGSEEEIPLYLDLGPEPSLTESIARPRPWFSGAKSASAHEVRARRGLAATTAAGSLVQTISDQIRGRWPWAVALAAAIALTLAAYILLRPGGGSAKEAPTSKPSPSRDPRVGRPGTEA